MPVFIKITDKAQNMPKSNPLTPKRKKHANNNSKCKHGNRVGRQCMQCLLNGTGGGDICRDTLKRKSRCLHCLLNKTGGSDICRETLKRKSRCSHCHGNEVCEHDKRKLSACSKCCRAATKQPKTKKSCATQPSHM